VIRVLVVEDDEFMRALLRLVFNREDDIKTVFPESGWERLAKDIDWSEVDVILVDQFLGNFRGSDLLGFLTAMHPRIRRIMYTGDTSISASGANAHLVIHKPRPDSGHADRLLWPERALREVHQGGSGWVVRRVRVRAVGDYRWLYKWGMVAARAGGSGCSRSARS
jgi:DNA-binding NarL/FixJ family response regulator